MMSPSIRSGAKLYQNSVSFTDANLLLESSARGQQCIDGSPHEVADLGLIFAKVRKLRIVKYRDLKPLPLRNYQIARMFISHNGYYMMVGDDGNSRWYQVHPYPRKIIYLTLYSNDSVTCWRLNPYFVCEENRGQVNHKKNLAHAVALAGLHQTKEHIYNRLLRRRSIVLFNITKSVGYGSQNISEGIRTRKTTIDVSWTNWVHQGMPLEAVERNPDLKDLREIELRQDAVLRTGCSHEAAMAVSFLGRLKTSGHTAYRNSPAEYKRHDGTEHVWIFGRKIRIGLVTHTDSEYCATIGRSKTCVSQENSTLHKLDHYGIFQSNATHVKEHKQGSFKIHGELSKRDFLDMAAHLVVQDFRGHSLLMLRSIREEVLNSARLIESGGLISGAVRLCGRGVLDNSVTNIRDYATINWLGIAGVVLLLLLIPIPLLSICIRGQRLGIDIETSFWRAVSELEKPDCGIIPQGPPRIFASELAEGKIFHFELFHRPVNVENGEHGLRSSERREGFCQRF